MGAAIPPIFVTLAGSLFSLTAPTALQTLRANSGATAWEKAVPAWLDVQNTFAAGTITTSQPTTFTQTWNASGTTFNALLLNVTDTASAASSLFIDLQVGSSSRFKVDKTGLVTVGTGGSSGSGTVNLLFFNQSTAQSPTIKWNAVSGSLGLRFISGSSEVARVQDNGAFVISSNISCNGMATSGNAVAQRGGGQQSIQFADMGGTTGNTNTAFEFDGKQYDHWTQDVLSKTSTTNSTLMSKQVFDWATSTHASRKARMTWSIYDTAAHEVMRFEASGTAAMIGFLGAAAVVRQTLSAAATDPGTTQTLVNDLRTAMINLGLAA